jgi:hypothetical protein
MARKNLTWAILALSGSLLAMTAATATQAADQPAKQMATSDAKPDTLMCRDLDIPGSHIKQRVCGVPAQWSEAQTRLYLMRVYPAVSHPATEYSASAMAGSALSSAGLSGSVQR